jgi:hypothetical protein
MQLKGSKRTQQHHGMDVLGPVTVCTIRNPLDLAVTWYEMYMHKGAARKHPEPLGVFLARFEADPYIRKGRIFYHLPTDVVIRQEHLAEDLKRFLEGLGLPMVKLRPTGATKGKRPWEEYYRKDPEAEGVLRGRFPLDFEVWESMLS